MAGETHDACVLCVAARGLRGQEIVSLPQSVEEFRAHLREVHGMELLDRGEEREMLARMRPLGPGIYDDGRGGVHVSAAELLAHLGIPYTVETEQIVADALREAGRKYGTRDFLEVVVVGD
jgi:hypothetical protein